MIVLYTPEAETVNLLFFQSRDFFALNTFFFIISDPSGISFKKIKLCFSNFNTALV